MKEKRVLYRMAGMDDVPLREVVAEGVAMDIYEAPGSRAALVIVAGYPDAGFQKRVGCSFRETGSTVSWARLIAASGMTAVAYSNREPLADLQIVLRRVRQEADVVAVWASSGNAPLALSLLMGDERIAGAALCYPLLFEVDEAAKAFGFANPCSGRSVDDLRSDVPILIARAGGDEFGASVDRFLPQAIEKNLPLTLVNHPDGPHAFDLLHDSETTRATVEQVLAFLRAQTGVGPRPSR